jgi:hypothetical protein
MNKVQKCSKELHRAMVDSGMIDAPSSCTVDSVVRPTPDYKLSFGGRFSIELEADGYKREGTCQMDNGLTGVVYCRRPNAEHDTRH